METRRLEVLLELSRLGSMRAVAEVRGTTTSTVSQQIAALAVEAGTALVEPDGRRVRLTPAGRRLAAHAEGIVAAVEAARAELDPTGEPAGTLRVASFATAIRRSLLPVVGVLGAEHPHVRLLISEQEPAEATARLAAGEVDLAITYDYGPAPAPRLPSVTATPLWTAAWGLGVPAGGAPPGLADGGTLAVLRHFGSADWIVNSRNTADEDVVRTLGSMAGVTPAVAHHVDSLELVHDLIVAGLGVGLLPVDGAPLPGVDLVPLHDPAVTLRAYALTRAGRDRWPPLELVLRLLAPWAERP